MNALDCGWRRWLNPAHMPPWWFLLSALIPSILVVALALLVGPHLR